MERTSGPHGRVREGSEAGSSGGLSCVWGCSPLMQKQSGCEAGEATSARPECVPTGSVVWFFVVAFRGSDGNCEGPAAAPSHPGGCLLGTTITSLPTSCGLRSKAVEPCPLCDWGIPAQRG